MCLKKTYLKLQPHLPGANEKTNWVYQGLVMCYPKKDDLIYRKISNIRDTKSQNINVSRLGLQLSKCNILKPSVNSLRPRQNRRHFADDVFKCNFLNENVWIPIKISLKFLSKGQMNNIPPLVLIMAWRRTGDKPISEPMITQFNDAYMRHSASMS